MITKYEFPRQEEKRKTIKWVHGKANMHKGCVRGDYWGDRTRWRQMSY